MFLLLIPLELATPFLLAGCLAFILCAAIRPLRKFALSTSLWCVACIPFLFAEIATVVIASAGWQGARYFLRDVSPYGWEIHFRKATWLAWLGFSLAILIIVAGATLVTLLHGWITRRMTLFLFRIYATGVATGVGFLSGLGVGFVLLLRRPEFTHVWTFAFAPLFAVIFGTLAFYNAAQLRGSYPKFLPVVTPEEFG